MGGECGMYGRGEKCIQNCSWKTEGKESLEGPRCRWEDSIKMNIRIECEGVD